MKLSISSYMSPGTDKDYSLHLSISVCEKWVENTICSDSPIDVTSFARQLANLKPTSDDVVFSMPSLDDYVTQFDVKVKPSQSDDIATVEVHRLEVDFDKETGSVSTSEMIVRETAILSQLNRLGEDLLAVSSSNPIFEFTYPWPTKKSDDDSPRRRYISTPQRSANQARDVFIPRLGKLTFHCKFCGEGPMQWSEVAPDVWIPFDLEKRENHHCWKKQQNNITVGFVADELNNMGYDAYVPRTSSWQMAFVASNQTGSLMFLIRKHGIDFKLYDKPQDFKLDKKGKLYTDGGQLVRNYYNESEVFVFNWILDIASRFITEAPFDSEHMVGQGKPWAFDKARSIRATHISEDEQSRRELQDIYDAISVGDGMDAYLGDGVWIGSDGSWSDRGR